MQLIKTNQIQKNKWKRTLSAIWFTQKVGPLTSVSANLRNWKEAEVRARPVAWPVFQGMHPRNFYVWLTEFSRPNLHVLYNKLNSYTLCPILLHYTMQSVDSLDLHLTVACWQLRIDNRFRLWFVIVIEKWISSSCSALRAAYNIINLITGVKTFQIGMSKRKDNDGKEEEAKKVPKVTKFIDSSQQTIRSFFFITKTNTSVQW